MTTLKERCIHQPEPTRILAPEELNARRARKALTTPCAHPRIPVEPARAGRRTVTHPSRSLFLV